MEAVYPLIGVCGLEGASKSTSLQTIQRVFSEEGIPSLTTREPGGTPLAEEIRTLHKRVSCEEVSPLTELLMMFASREQSYQNLVIPSLSEQCVITDRFWACSYAYQIAGLPENHPKRTMLRKVFEQLVTALTVSARHKHVLWLDVDPEIGMARARQRGELDRIEQREIDYFHRARKGYAELHGKHDEFHRVDANNSIDEVQRDVEDWARNTAKRIQFDLDLQQL